MGALLSSFFVKESIPICVFGLDNVGKTTMCHIQLPQNYTPFIGFACETYEFKGMTFTLFDVGGCDKIRPLYKHFFTNSKALIFMVDSTDRERFDIVEKEFKYLLDSQELIGCPFLIMANKQDLESAMSLQEITEKLKLNNVFDRYWKVQGTCAITGQGLDEGLDWINTIKTQKGNKLMIENKSSSISLSK